LSNKSATTTASAEASKNESSGETGVIAHQEDYGRDDSGEDHESYDKEDKDDDESATRPNEAGEIPPDPGELTLKHSEADEIPDPGELARTLEHSEADELPPDITLKEEHRNYNGQNGSGSGSIVIEKGRLICTLALEGLNVKYAMNLYGFDDKFALKHDLLAQQEANFHIEEAQPDTHHHHTQVELKTPHEIRILEFIRIGEFTENDMKNNMSFKPVLEIDHCVAKKQRYVLTKGKVFSDIRRICFCVDWGLQADALMKAKNPLVRLKQILTNHPGFKWPKLCLKKIFHT
jgi:hypothetical protein